MLTERASTGERNLVFEDRGLIWVGDTPFEKTDWLLAAFRFYTGGKNIQMAGVKVTVPDLAWGSVDVAGLKMPYGDYLGFLEESLKESVPSGCPAQEHQVVLLALKRYLAKRRDLNPHWGAPYEDREGLRQVADLERQHIDSNGINGLRLARLYYGRGSVA